MFMDTVTKITLPQNDLEAWHNFQNILYNNK